MKNRAFTLIELLVVVLIIGILAAIAVPQYQKAVWKARSRQMLVSIKAVKDASQAYYLAHNEYPTKFSDLDISLTGYDKECQNPFGDKTDCLANDSSELTMNSYHEILATFPNGPYQWDAFLVRQEPVFNGEVSLNKILCYHHTALHEKNMCTEFFGCEVELEANGDNYYSCPNL